MLYYLRSPEPVPETEPVDTEKEEREAKQAQDRLERVLFKEHKACVSHMNAKELWSCEKDKAEMMFTAKVKQVTEDAIFSYCHGKLNISRVMLYADLDQLFDEAVRSLEIYYLRPNVAKLLCHLI